MGRWPAGAQRASLRTRPRAPTSRLAQNNYRVGKDGKYDLIYAEGEEPKPPKEEHRPQAGDELLRALVSALVATIAPETESKETDVARATGSANLLAALRAYIAVMAAATSVNGLTIASDFVACMSNLVASRGPLPRKKRSEVPGSVRHMLSVLLEIMIKRAMEECFHIIDAVRNSAHTSAAAAATAQELDWDSLHVVARFVTSLRAKEDAATKEAERQRALERERERERRREEEERREKDKGAKKDDAAEDDEPDMPVDADHELLLLEQLADHSRLFYDVKALVWGGAVGVRLQPASCPVPRVDR